MTREWGGHTWYVVSRRFPTAVMAKSAFDRAERGLNMKAGDQGIGIVRVSPNPRADTPASKGGQAHGVVCVTLDEPTAHKASRLIKGAAWTIEPAFADALIARRARVVMANAGQGEGRMLIRRPEGAGAELDKYGHMHERPRGQG